MAESKCPLPTQDIKTNLANRQKAIDVAHYGPANPKEPNEEYWTAKAKIFGGSVKEAKTMRCGNCAGFNQTSKLTDCISKGIGSDAQEVEQAGDLGYCEIFDFKCASLRTCDAWIVGGPITDKTNLEQLKADLLSLKQQGATLLYDPSQARDESGRWTDGGFASGAETPREISNRIISRIQKENPEINIEDGKFKKAVESLGENLKGAKILPQYGQTKTKEISNWIKSDKGQKLIGAVDKTLKVTGAGAIGALKGLDEAKFDIATNAIFAPQIIPFIATRSAMQGIFNNAVKEYRSIKKGEEIKTAVRRQVGVKPLESIITVTQFQEEININDVVEYLTDVLRVSILKYIKNTKKFEIATFAYNPDQARDDSGKWTSIGGKVGEILVSPNIKENMNYEEAKKMTDSPEHARAVSIAKDVIKKQQMDGKIESGVGDWEDGAENSIKIDVKGVKDFDQLQYTASKLGAMLNQKAVVAFQKKKDGPDILHKISADKPMDQVRKMLSENGISFRTMVGDRAKTSVTILDKGSQLTANVAKFLGAINGKSEAVRGVGEFIGGDTRIAGKKAYKEIIDNYERSFPNRVHLGLQRRGGRNYYRSYQAIEFYDPSQQRDESGKWTGGGGIAQGSTPTPRWAQDNPAEASKKTGEATTLYHGTSADVLKNIRKDGLKPSKSGVWGGGKVYSTDSLDLAMEYGVLRSGTAPKIGGKQLIGIISILAEGFKSVADNIPTTKAQKMGKTGIAAVSKIFTKNGGVAPSAIKKMQIFDVDSIRKYVYENGPKPSPLATKELAEGSQLIYVPIVIQLPDDGSEGFQFDDAVAVESFVFQYNGEKIEFYDASQPRDENGKWSSQSGIFKSIKNIIFDNIKIKGANSIARKKAFESDVTKIAESFAKKNITPEEAISHLQNINNYTDTSLNMNISLRDKIEKNADKESKKYYKEEIEKAEKLQETLKIMPKTEDDTLYRGIFDSEGDYDTKKRIDYLAGKTKVGDIFTDLAFTSATRSEQVAQTAFAKIKPDFFTKNHSKEDLDKEGWGSKVLMKIVGTKGRGVDIPKFIGVDGEDETILPKGSKFKILNIQRILIFQPKPNDPSYVKKAGNKYITKIEAKLL